jgi:hypothetical protein
MQRLLQKFYLIDTKKAFTKRKAGTAVGLAISRGGLLRLMEEGYG